MANAQTLVTNATSITLWAGTADNLQFGLASLTAPTSGVILSGTAVSAITGQPVRHLWYGDPVSGICRIDPEVDAVIPAVGGIGGHFTNPVTCTGTLGKAAFTPSQIAYDPNTQTLYAGSSSKTNLGVIRLQYIPSGDSGQGLINPLTVTSLIGTQSTRNAQGACPQIKDPFNGSLVPNVPDAAAIGPDGNLYAGSVKDGAVIRIVSPAAFNPATDCPNNGNGSVVAQATDKINVPILSTDERNGPGHTFGLGFIGTTLLGGDNIAPWILLNATQCFTPLNGNKVCGAPPMGGQAPAPIEFLNALVPAPSAAVVTDAQFPASPGNSAYFASAATVAKASNIIASNNLTVQTNYGGTFVRITGLTADPSNVTSASLYVGVDSSQLGLNGAGAIWQVSPNCPAAPAPPPSSVSAAVSTIASDTATVSWVPTAGCTPATSYLVQTLISTGLPSDVLDQTIAAPATSAVIGGLTDGGSYVFQVQGCNAVGCSAFSPLSNAVTAVTLLPPDVASVTGADAGTGTSANVAWTLSSNGGSPVTSSTVSAFDTLNPLVPASTATVIGSGTAAIVGGLTCGESYTFTVVATNVIGSSLVSPPSLPVLIACQTTADVSVTMSAPVSVSAGSLLTYTMTVHNGGAADAAQVLLSDTLPAPFSSASSTQGVCSSAVGLTSVTCNLGAMAAGATATVTVSVSIPSGICTGLFTSTATVSALDALGVNVDPNLLNNTASATAALTSSAACGATTTDIQVGGSAKNGGPALGSTDTFTWQIKDNLGTVAANSVVFTSNMSSIFSQIVVTSTQGTCSVFLNAITCQLGTINGGGSATVTVNFNVGKVAAQFLTTGTATFNGTDTNPANNSFTVSISPK
jgi:uncharacterized repeat protein (TIGR01451 family)